MSEMRTYECWVYNLGCRADMVSKAEADAVIAELKADYREACDRLQTANLIKDEQLAATRHHKYHRCLNMAARCESEEKRLDAIAPLFDNDKECWEYSSDFLSKWARRWLKIAEQFKECA